MFLFGPTGVGKTELLEELFSDDYGVVNADSKQIYRYMDVGSAKPSPELRAKIPHYLIDILDPWESFSVGEFVKLADKACQELRALNKIPIICGGTAYYFKHFYYGLPTSPKSDPKVRRKVADEVAKRGLLWAYGRLEKVDPLSAAKIHPADRYRLTRALEVYETSGKPLSGYTLPNRAREGVNPVVIGLFRDKEELAQRIQARVEQMFEEGLVAEVEKLLQMGANAAWPGMQGIGYKEFLSGSPEQAKAEIVRNSKRYAKRQMTFFRSLEGVNWVHPADKKKILSLVNQSGLF
ncbi:MAG: tRNA (adenosine(37)-N6)-dimethylallyltransferase MiaA [Sphaerochaetaceae bacterium]